MPTGAAAVSVAATAANCCCGDITYLLQGSYHGTFNNLH